MLNFNNPFMKDLCVKCGTFKDDFGKCECQEEYGWTYQKLEKWLEEIGFQEKEKEEGMFTIELRQSTYGEYVRNIRLFANLGMLLKNYGYVNEMTGYKILVNWDIEKMKDLSFE